MIDLSFPGSRKVENETNLSQPSGLYGFSGFQHGQNLVTIPKVVNFPLSLQIVGSQSAPQWQKSETTFSRGASSSSEQDCSEFSQSLNRKQETNDKRNKSNKGRARKPGRPPSLFVDVSDSELTAEERKLKAKILKRRQRQNRSYQRKKLEKNLQRKDLCNDKLQCSMGSTSWVTKNTGQVTTASSCTFAPESEFVKHQPDITNYPSYQADEYDGYLSNTFSGTSSFEGSSIEDPLQQILSEDTPKRTICEQRDGMFGRTDWSSSCCIDPSSYYIQMEESDDTPLSHSLLLRLRTRFHEIPVASQEAWKVLCMFPDSFDFSAVVHVLGFPETDCSVVIDILEPLEKQNLIQVFKDGRMQLNRLAKFFATEELLDEGAEHSEKLCSSKYRFLVIIVIQRNVDDIHFLQEGSCKQQAEHIYALEKSNIKYSFRLAKELGTNICRWFYASIGNFLRHCMDSETRLKEFLQVLQTDDEITNEKGSVLNGLPESPCGVEYINFGVESFKSSLSSMPLFHMNSTVSVSLDNIIIHRMIGEVYFEKRDLKNAKEHLNTSLRLMEEQKVQHCTNELFCLYLLSCIEKQKGNFECALMLAQKAKNCIHTLELNYSIISTCLNILIASIFIKQNCLTEAHRILTETIQTIQATAMNNFVPPLLELDGLLGVVSQVQGKTTLAQQYFEQAKKCSKFSCYGKVLETSREYLLDEDTWNWLNNGEDAPSACARKYKKCTDTCCPIDFSRLYLDSGGNNLSAIQEEYETYDREPLDFLLEYEFPSATENKSMEIIGE
eukprot:jgi/Galph1/1104/GphlegSOOS_G5803.1